MAAIPPNPRTMDEDAKLDFLEKKAKRKFKLEQRKVRRDAENAQSELNLTAMMDVMTILLVFLIKSFGAADINVAMGDDLMPPTSTSTLVPVNAVTVTITAKDIAVGEKGVVRLTENRTVPAESLGKDSAGNSTLLIVPVKEALEREVERLTEQARWNPAMRDKAGTDKDPLKMLTVVGDKDTPYDLLYSVLGTAGEAGLKYFKFLVISNT